MRGVVFFDIATTWTSLPRSEIFSRNDVPSGGSWTALHVAARRDPSEYGFNLSPQQGEKQGPRLYGWELVLREIPRAFRWRMDPVPDQFSLG